MTEATGEGPVSRSALRKAAWRLLPLIGLGYGISYMDRVNISFAALQMNADLHFSATIYGLGGGLFFLSYAVLEVPSNLMLVKFGARRWIARIMVTWGVLAVGMMLVRTPVQFYIMRLLLGAAEAGFFPGVVYYLSQWFPATHRGRTISRFYIAVPISLIFMGSIAGALLSLQGRLGLAGWQWLFLAEGLPAVILGFVILKVLPDGPADAGWLTESERDWLEKTLAAERGVEQSGGLLALLRVAANPRVLAMAVAALCLMTVSYAVSLVAPAILVAATHLDASRVGYVVAASGVSGVAAMLFTGWSTDRTRAPYIHAAAPQIFCAIACVILAVTSSPVVAILAYIVVVASGNATQIAFWTVPGQLLSGRQVAVGVAAVGGISMIGAFIGPYATGLAKDHTGSFQAGLIALVVPCLIAAGIVLAVRQSPKTAAFGHLASAE